MKLFSLSKRITGENYGEGGILFLVQKLRVMQGGCHRKSPAVTQGFFVNGLAKSRSL